jgi:CHASE3 domain sensor protein
MTPEMYVATCIVKALFIGIFAIPFLFFLPILSLVIAVIAVIIYYNESKKVGNIIKERRRKIEYELPRLVSTIEKSLVHSRDVLTILDSYKDSAGDELKRELEITVADMRSGNYEVALTRLESRVGSSMMSDITRGLIGVIRGDETSVYWGTLNLKFSDYQRQNLKIEANRAPKRVRKLSMILLVCFMLIYVVVIGSVLIGSLGGLLG